MLKKLLCLVLGHKTAKQYFDDQSGDIITACPRCMTLLREPDLVYPEEMKEMSPGVSKGPITLPAAGDVTCEKCARAWHSHHPISGPVLCSPCRIRQDISLLEGRIKSMKEAGASRDEYRHLELLSEAQKKALAELEAAA
jgi:hypothetical protein